MLIQLMTAEKNLSIPLGAWKQALHDAKAAGWQPAGTVLEDDPRWVKDYASSHGQYIQEQDAANLAEGLLKVDVGLYGELAQFLLGGARVWLT